MHHLSLLLFNDLLFVKDGNVVDRPPVGVRARRGNRQRLAVGGHRAGLSPDQFPALSAAPDYGVSVYAPIGIAGALVASFLFPKLGIVIGSGLVSEIVYSAIGAVILLLIVRLVRGGGRW